MFLFKVRRATKSVFRSRFFFSTGPNPREKDPLVSHFFSLLHCSPDVKHLRHLHARLLVTSLYSNVILSSKLVLAYSRHSRLDQDALSVFFHMPHRNIYSWNIIIGKFSRSCLPQKSIELFSHMWRGSGDGGVRPDDYSFPLVLRACAGTGSAELGVLLHGLSLKMGLGMSLFVGSALVFMYVTFGKMLDARELFDGLPEKDAVLWTAMLSGYAQHVKPVLGLEVFREMVGVGVQLDGVVMVSLLLMCSHLGWLKHGKSVHGWCLRNCAGLELSLGNAIVDMYSKCSALSYAHRAFDKMPAKDVFSWSSLILGYGLSGNVGIALDLFDQMLVKGVRPNDVTFLGILSACAHGGLVEKAQTCLKMMQDYGVVPELKHYATMIDCLGRAGLLSEAEWFIEEMPTDPDAAILGALLAACRVHNNVEIGGRIAKRLIKLEPQKAGYYVVLSNMYAEAGMPSEAEMARDLMQEKNVTKVPACSFIESEIGFALPS